MMPIRVLGDLVWLPVVAGLLRAFGYVKTHDLLLRFTKTDTSAVGDQQMIERLSRSVGLAARILPGRYRCLSKSMLLVWMLRQRGVPATLVIGIRRQEQHLSSHAWVEHRGLPVNERAEVCAGFTVIDKI